MVDGGDVQAEARFAMLAALAIEVRPGFDEDAAPSSGFFEVGGEAFLEAIARSDFDKASVGAVEVGKQGFGVRL